MRSFVPALDEIIKNGNPEPGTPFTWDGERFVEAEPVTAEPVTAELLSVESGEPVYYSYLGAVGDGQPAVVVDWKIVRGSYIEGWAIVRLLSDGSYQTAGIDYLRYRER